MKELVGTSKELLAENIEKLRKLFPEVFIEDKIDFPRLQQVLGDYIDHNEERYRLEWKGKSQALKISQTPSSGTLRPAKGESKNWDTTENLYIEGDNLEVLKLLQKTYNNRIKMIYIDPPYNTGKDFVYKDDFKDSLKNYLELTNQVDGEGKKQGTNTEAGGRYHTNWLNMIYPRLRLARNLLRDDGVIFISIDDNEVDNLRKICNEIFGEGNFIAQCVRKRRDSQANLSKNISPIHEYLLIYGRTGDGMLNKISVDVDEAAYKNPDNDPRGPYVTMPCTNKGGAVYSVTTPTGKAITEEWRFKEETYQRLLAENKIVFPRGGDGKPRYKLFLSEKKEQGVLANTWLDNVASNQEASREIKELFGDLVFDTPKPTGLLKFCLELATDKDSIVLDFFSGSATTAHAVMAQNAQDGGRRRFILVQLPEATDVRSLANQGGYRDICALGKERIRRAGEKILKESKERSANVNADQDANLNVDIMIDGSIEKAIDKEAIDKEAGEKVVKDQGKDIDNPVDGLDVGFKVLKLDTSNLKKWNPDYDNLEQTLDYMMDNFIEERTEEDVLYEIILKYGLDLTLPVEIIEIKGHRVFSVDRGALIACLAQEINLDIVQGIVQLKEELEGETVRVVFKDNGFQSDAIKTNALQILNRHGIEEVLSI